MNHQPALLLCFLTLQPTSSSSAEDWQWRNPLPQGNHLSGISIIDQNTFVAVGDSRSVLRTTDAGLTWSTDFFVGGEDGLLAAVDFADSINGIAVGDGGVILRTTDGGISWTSGPSPVVVDLKDVSYIDPDVAVAVGNSGMIVKTTDGGQAWTTQVSGTGTNLFSCSFVDKNI